MAHKSGLEVAGGLAHFAKALYDIIKAFMQGGWAAAALQALKHYWPQILAIALVLILLPVIIFCCLPMMLFGFASSTDTEISAMTIQAETVSGYYDSYESYIDDPGNRRHGRNQIRGSVFGFKNTEKLVHSVVLGYCRERS